MCVIIYLKADEDDSLTARSIVIIPKIKFIFFSLSLDSLLLQSITLHLDTNAATWLSTPAQVLLTNHVLSPLVLETLPMQSVLQLATEENTA